MLIILAILTSCTKLTMCIRGAPGVPVPGAELLEKIFSQRLAVDGSLSNYLKGIKSNDTDYASYNLDISVMDLQTVRKLINMAKKKHETQFRRQFYNLPRETTPNILQTAGFKTHIRENRFVNIYGHDSYGEHVHERYRDKITLMMKQSIYATRYRIEETKPVRAKFVGEPSYKIALLAGACTHYMYKMESLYSKASVGFRNFQVFFLKYLIIYEKILESNIDLNYAVERIFVMQNVYLTAQAGKPKIPKGLSVDSSAYTSLMTQFDPETLQKMAGESTLSPEVQAEIDAQQALIAMG